MSAIGSVIVMAWWPSSPWFPPRTFGVVGGRRRRPGWSWAPRQRAPGFRAPGNGTAGLAAPRLPLAAFSSVNSPPGCLPPRPCQGLPGTAAHYSSAPLPGTLGWHRRLPAGLRDARQLTAVRHGPKANPAQPEPPVHRARPPAARAPGVGAHFELGLPLRLGDQRLLRHSSALSERESEPAQQRAALLIGGGGGYHGHVHAALAVHLVGVDLVEHQLLGQAEGVVAPAVELPVGQPAEV